MESEEQEKLVLDDLEEIKKYLEDEKGLLGIEREQKIEKAIAEINSEYSTKLEENEAKLKDVEATIKEMRRD